jgi:hypothetical protein
MAMHRSDCQMEQILWNYFELFIWLGNTGLLDSFQELHLFPPAGDHQSPDITVAAVRRDANFLFEQPTEVGASAHYFHLWAETDCFWYAILSSEYSFTSS